MTLLLWGVAGAVAIAFAAQILPKLLHRLLHEPPRLTVFNGKRRTY